MERTLSPTWLLPTLCFSSAYHPQSDGQMTAVNLIVEMYLRCFSGDLPKKWLQCVISVRILSQHGLIVIMVRILLQHGLPILSVSHTFWGSLWSAQLRLLAYYPGLSKIEAVDQELLTRNEVLQNLRDRLAHAQNVYEILESGRSVSSWRTGSPSLLGLLPRKCGLPWQSETITKFLRTFCSWRTRGSCSLQTHSPRVWPHPPSVPCLCPQTV